jgi:ATP-dependent Clp protease ATP-binding subunit ClpA
MITVMARRFKANVLMVGDPGVGKTCIVEGLAQRSLLAVCPSLSKITKYGAWKLDHCWQAASIAASLKKSSRL